MEECAGEEGGITVGEAWRRRVNVLHIGYEVVAKKEGFVVWGANGQILVPLPLLTAGYSTCTIGYYIFLTELFDLNI